MKTRFDLLPAAMAFSQLLLDHAPFSVSSEADDEHAQDANEAPPSRDKRAPLTSDGSRRSARNDR